MLTIAAYLLIIAGYAAVPAVLFVVARTLRGKWSN